MKTLSIMRQDKAVHILTQEELHEGLQRTNQNKMGWIITKQNGGCREWSHRRLMDGGPTLSSPSYWSAWRMRNGNLVIMISWAPIRKKHVQTAWSECPSWRGMTVLPILIKHLNSLSLSLSLSHISEQEREFPLAKILKRKKENTN